MLRCRAILLVSAALFEMRDEWIALPRHHLPEGDMGDIYRKLSFNSYVLPNAPKCNRQLIPNAMTRDTTWRMRVPDRAALSSIFSRGGHRRPSGVIYPKIAGQLTSGFRGSVLARRDSAI